MNKQSWRSITWECPQATKWFTLSFEAPPKEKKWVWIKSTMVLNRQHTWSKRIAFSFFKMQRHYTSHDFTNRVARFATNLSNRISPIFIGTLFRISLIYYSRSQHASQTARASKTHSLTASTAKSPVQPPVIISERRCSSLHWIQNLSALPVDTHPREVRLFRVYGQRTRSRVRNTQYGKIHMFCSLQCFTTSLLRWSLSPWPR